jgi:hypothetical protein
MPRGRFGQAFLVGECVLWVEPVAGVLGKRAQPWSAGGRRLCSGGAAIQGVLLGMAKRERWTRGGGGGLEGGRVLVRPLQSRRKVRI